MCQESDLASNKDAIPKHYQLFRALDLTYRHYAIHTVRITTTLVEVDEYMAKVRIKLMQELQQKAGDDEDFAACAIKAAANRKREVTSELEARREETMQKRARVSRGST